MEVGKTKDASTNKKKRSMNLTESREYQKETVIQATLLSPAPAGQGQSKLGYGLPPALAPHLST